MPFTSIADHPLELAIVADPLIVQPDIPVLEAIRQMNAVRAMLPPGSRIEAQKTFLQAEARATCLLVLEATELVGILTDWDVMQLTATGESLANLSLREVMRRSIVTLQQSDYPNLASALHLFQQHPNRHIPVLNAQGHVVGLLTRELLYHTLAEMLNEQVFRVDSPQMEFLKRHSTHLKYQVEQQLAELNYQVEPTHLELEQQALIETLQQLNEELERKIAQHAEKYQQSEEQLRQIFEQNPVGIAISDLDGKIIRVNSSISHILGKKRPDLLQQSIQSILPKISNKIGQPFFQDLIDHTLPVINFESQFVSDQGKPVWVNVSSALILDASGQPTSIIHLLEDVSKRKQAEEQLHQTLQELSDFKYALNEGQIVAITDVTGVITYANQQFCKVSKYSCEELVGNTHRLVNSGYHPKSFFRDLWATIAKGTIWRGEIYNRAKDGTYYWTDSTIIPFLDAQGQPRQYLAIRTDITARKQIEAELARANRLKDEFLANMSHELRTPLNAVLGMSEALQEQVFGSINPEQKRAIATIEQSGKHLLELINDILDLSKIESGKLELQINPVSIQHLCDTSLTFVRQLAIRKRIQLTAEISTHLSHISVDERRIRQVLINLLNNAVKFTPEGGSVRLVISQPLQTNGCFILFQVFDNGIGIDSQDFNKLFQPFVQIDSSLTRQYMGTGLGLSLVQQLTQLHGGTVTVTSEVGKGSCFTVQIPCSYPLDHPTTQLCPTPQPIESLPHSSSKTVLVIEDIPSSAEQTSRYLSEVGLETKVYGTGRGALEAVIHTQPILVILDILLPDLSGWEVLIQLKSHPQTQAIPIVITSVVEEQSRAMALGAAGYLVKPINRQQLRATLNSLHLSVSLPMTPGAVTDSPRLQETVETPSILIAEDNEANIATFSSYLRSCGFQLILAKDGVEALSLVEAHHPSLIVMDIQMPTMDGLTAIRQLRSNPATIEIPIIALTALAMPGDREKCLAAGANEYITKPVKLKFLAELIQRLLRR